MSAVSSASIIQATSNAPWDVYVRPFLITDQLYYIGNLWVGAYLIDTTDGLILLDTMCAETAYLMVDSIYRLGYKPEQIRYILLSHAHIDHEGGAQMLKKLSGAKIYLSREDDAFRRDKRAQSASASRPTDVSFRYYDFDVDRYYDDNTPIVLGNVTIRTRLTPGHTPGVTTFFIRICPEGKKPVTAAMHGGVGVLTMSDLYFEQSGLSPSLRTRFVKDCDAMKSEQVDICLPSHPAHYPGDFFTLSRMKKGGKPALQDPGAWKRFLEERGCLAKQLILV